MNNPDLHRSGFFIVLISDINLNQAVIPIKAGAQQLCSNSPLSQIHWNEHYEEK